MVAAANRAGGGGVPGRGPSETAGAPGMIPKPHRLQALWPPPLLGRKTSLVILNSLVGAILGFAALKAVALYMGVEVYGRYAFALGLSGVFMFLSNLGFSKAHVKRVSEGRPLGDCIATFGVVSLLLTLLYAGLTLGGLALGTRVLGQQLYSTTETTLTFVILGRTLSILRRVANLTFQARLDTARSESIGFTASTTQSTAMIVIALLYAGATRREGPLYDVLLEMTPGLASLIAQNGAELLGFAFLLSALVATPLGFYLLFRHYRLGRFDGDLFRDYLRYAVPLMFGIGVTAFGTDFDKAALGFFWSEREAGLFTGVQRLMVVITMITGAVQALFFPAISERHAQDDEAGARRLTATTLRYLSMLLVPAAFGLTALARPAINIVLSAQWLAAAPILGVLAFATLLMGLAGPFNNVLYGFDRPKRAVALDVSRVVLKVALIGFFVPASIFSIPALGLRGVGAALAILVAAAAHLALVGHQAQALVGRIEGLPRLLWHWVAGAIMAVVVWLVHTEVFALERWFHVPPFVLFGAALYFLLLFLMRELKREDVEFFWAALHPGDMGRYIRSELIGKERE